MGTIVPISVAGHILQQFPQEGSKYYTSLNKNISLYQGLKLLALPGNSTRYGATNLVNNWKKLLQGSGPDITFGPYGKQISSAGGGGVEWIDPYNLGLAQQITIISLCNFANCANFVGSPFFAAGSAFNTSRWFMVATAGGTALDASLNHQGTGSSNCSASLTGSSRYLWNVVGVVSNSGVNSGTQFWNNGTKSGTATTCTARSTYESGLGANEPFATIATNGNASASWGSNSKLVMTAVWNRLLSDAEMNLVGKNPLILFDYKKQIFIDLSIPKGTQTVVGYK